MKDKGGRPTKLTKEVVMKLEEVFAIDGTVEEACFYADISRNAYYEWIKNNPKLNDRFKALRNNPVLRARNRVMKGIDESYQNAMDYLKRKKRLEFGDNMDLTNKGDKFESLNEELQNKIDKSLNTYLDDIKNTQGE